MIFVNVDGQKKIIRGHVTELEFDNEVANTGLPTRKLFFSHFSLTEH